MVSFNTSLVCTLYSASLHAVPRASPNTLQLRGVSIVKCQCVNYPNPKLTHKLTRSDPMRAQCSADCRPGQPQGHPDLLSARIAKSVGPLGKLWSI